MPSSGSQPVGVHWRQCHAPYRASRPPRRPRRGPVRLIAATRWFLFRRGCRPRRKGGAHRSACAMTGRRPANSAAICGQKLRRSICMAWISALRRKIAVDDDEAVVACWRKARTECHRFGQGMVCRHPRVKDVARTSIVWAVGGTLFLIGWETGQDLVLLQDVVERPRDESAHRRSTRAASQIRDVLTSDRDRVSHGPIISETPGTIARCSCP